MQLDTPTTDQQISRALARGHVIDITTTGRRSGMPRRIEMVFHNLDGHIYISGMPSRRTRAWLHNLAADPHFTFHLKRTVSAALPATARIVTDEAERREVLTRIAQIWGREDVETMTRYSPLIEVTLEDVPAGTRPGR